MNFQKFDAGALSRTPAAKGRDCQVRALSSALGVASGVVRAQALDELEVTGASLALDLVEELPGVGVFHVVRSLDFPAIRGKRRMTAAAFCKLYPKGRFILRMEHHVACVKDGKILDTHDCSDRCVYAAWEIEPREKHE